MDKVEVLKSATADEIKEANPTIVSEMVAEAVEAKETELQSVVAEMTEVKTALGLAEDASAVETIQEMASKLNDMRLDTELRDKVESSTARKVVKQLVISEMASGTTVDEAVDKVLASETGQAIVKEMLDVAPRVAPMTMQPVAQARKYTKKG